MVLEQHRRSGGILLWFSQRLSGLFLLVMLLSHFYFLHYYQEGFVTYDKVAARLASNSWKVFDLSFLVLALFHGMNGLWTLILEYVHNEKKQRYFLRILLVMSVLLLGVGGYSIVRFTVKA
jgi:succinate dehydrogenase hydrophobic membrane anchor protein